MRSSTIPVGRVKRILAHPMIRNNSYFLVSTAAVGVANYLLNTSATRHFAPGDYSQFGVVLSLALFLLPVAGALSSAVLRRASLDRARGNTAATAAVLRALVRYLSLAFAALLAGVFLARVPIARFLHLTSATPLYFVVVSTYWVFLQGLLQALLQEEGRYRRISGVYIAEGAFRGAVGVTVIDLGLGANVTLAVYALSALLATLWLPRPAAFWTGARASWGTLTSVYRDAGPLLLSNIGFSVITTLDVTLCRRYLVPATADQYVAAAQIAKLFLAATSSVGMIAFAEVVKAAHRGESSARPLGVSLALIGGLGGPFVAACALLGPFVMPLIFGDRFHPSGPVLWITATSAFAISLLNLEVAYFNARHWLGYLPVFLLGSGVTIAVLPLTHGSLSGYAAAYAITTAVLALVFLVPVFLGLTGRVTLGSAGPAPPALDAPPASSGPHGAG